MKVFVPGTFDGFHKGHKELLKYAILIAGKDEVIVRVNTDHFIRNYKNAQPIMTEEQRVEAVAVYSDTIYLNSDDALNLFLSHAPCLILHGGEWNRKKLSERYEVSEEWWEENNLHLIFKERVDNTSSSEMRKKFSIKKYPNLFPYTKEPIRGKEAERTLQKARGVLRENHLKWWISAGTLLGLYRDGSLIPHDNDVDVSVDASSVLHGGALIADFYNQGFELVRNSSMGTDTAQLAFLDKENNVILDISFYYLRGKNYVKSTEFGDFSHPRKFIDKLSSIKFGGDTYPAPSSTEEFLARRYGEDWRTPKNNKGDWRRDVGESFIPRQ